MSAKLLILIVSMSVLIRLVAIDQSLWLDEGISTSVAENFNYRTIVTDFSPGDFHPPLHYLVLKLFTDVLGSSELPARLPSIIFGSLTVLMVYLLAKKLYDTRTALTAAVLLATSPLHIYYSQEARMYSQATFFSLTSLYFFISILQKDKLVNWIGFISSLVFALYTDYMPGFLLLAYVAYVLFFRKKISKTTIKSFVPAAILIFVSLLPWAGIFYNQLKIGLSLPATTPQWHSVIGSATPRDLGLVFTKFIIGQISVDNNLTYLLLFLPIGLYVTFLIFVSSLRMSVIRSTLWFYLLLPVLSSFLLSFYIPAFTYFRLLYVLPALYVILASAINNLHWTKPTIAMLTLMLAVNIISATIYLTNPKFQREDWKSATSYIKENKTDSTVVLFESNYVISPFDYYNRGEVEAVGVLDSFTPDPEKVSGNVKAATAGKNKLFLFQYLSPISDPQGIVFRSLIENGFKNTGTKDFRGVGFVYEFTK